MNKALRPPTTFAICLGNLKSLLKAVLRFGLRIYFAVLDAVDKGLIRFGFQRKSRILIECLEVFHYHHIKPVVDKLLEDPRLRLFLLETPHFCRKVVPQEIARPEQFLPLWKALYVPFDLTVSLDYEHNPWILHRGVQIAAPHGGGMKANYNTPERLARYDALWAVSERQRQNFKESLQNENVLENIGFIVTDQLANKTVDASAVRRRLNLDNHSPIVLYAPSWSDNPDMILMSEEILVTLHRQQQFNIIVRPHPLLLRPSRTGGRDFGRILSRLTDERFKLADAADVPIQEYMAASDILVSDISSVVFEYLFLDRPILVQTNASVISYYDGEAYLKDILPAVTVFHVAD